jgi:hypothetical protein
LFVCFFLFFYFFFFFLLQNLIKKDFLVQSEFLFSKRSHPKSLPMLTVYTQAQVLAILSRVDVLNLAQTANGRGLTKSSLELQLCPLFQINRLDQNPLGLLPLVKSINFKEGTRLQLQRRFYQTASIRSLRQTAHIDPKHTTCSYPQKNPLTSFPAGRGRDDGSYR